MAKKAKSTNFAKIAKVTRNILVILKGRETNVSRIAWITILTKFYTSREKRPRRASRRPQRKMARKAKSTNFAKMAKVTRILEATVQNLYDLNQDTSVVVRKKFQLRCKKDLHRKEEEISSYKRRFLCSYHTFRYKLQPHRAPKLMMLSGS